VAVAVPEDRAPGTPPLKPPEVVVAEVTDPAAPADAAPPRTRPLRLAWDLVKVVVAVVVVVTLLHAYVVEPYVVHGTSMEPTFESSQRLFVSKFVPNLESIERGDIVIFEHPLEEGKRLIKRVIGLEGDRIEIRAGRVYLNDARLEEPYISAPDDTFFGPHTVEAGCFFALGDNRAFSDDSRRFGDVKVKTVVGRALLRFYPIRSIKLY